MKYPDTVYFYPFLVHSGYRIWVYHPGLAEISAPDEGFPLQTIASFQRLMCRMGGHDACRMGPSTV